MPENLCSRCGRERDADEGHFLLQVDQFLPAGGLLEFSVFRGAGPWASIDGHDVCPQCQTPSEQSDVARRIVAAVEAEVERISARSLDATPPEAELIAYAMQL